MVVEQIRLTAPGRFDGLAALAAVDPQWLVVFAAPVWFADDQLFAELRRLMPQARISGCSTAGEISRDGVSDGSCVITAVRWQTEAPRVVTTEVASIEDSLAAGMRLGHALGDAAAAVVFAPGVDINGSALVEGIAAALPPGTPIVGGLAGDGADFRKTYTLCTEGIRNRAVVAVGLPRGVRVSHGSFGGWRPFGPARKVTQSNGSILHELDGEPALSVYKRYLGPHARDLPASGLLFPFEMLTADQAPTGQIRTILGVDEATGSLLLAGDVEPRGYLRLMHADTTALVGGAATAAQAAAASGGRAGLALLVSCIGRKLVMGSRVDEEVEAAAAVLGADVVAGFYSYGEISPLSTGSSCRLLNQTMTITCFGELADGA